MIILDKISLLIGITWKIVNALWYVIYLLLTLIGLVVAYLFEKFAFIVSEAIDYIFRIIFYISINGIYLAYKFVIMLGFSIYYIFVFLFSGIVSFLKILYYGLLWVTKKLKVALEDFLSTIAYFALMLFNFIFVKKDSSLNHEQQIKVLKKTSTIKKTKFLFKKTNISWQQRTSKAIEVLLESKIWKVGVIFYNAIISILGLGAYVVTLTWLLLKNMYLFFRNFFLILIIIVKGSVVGFIQLFKKDTWLNFATELSNFGREVAKVFIGSVIFIKKEIRVIVIISFKIVRSLFILISKDMFIMVFRWLKYNKLNFMGILILFSIIMMGVLTVSNNKEEFFVKVEKWSNTVGFIKISKAVAEGMKSDIFNPIRFYKTKIVVESGNSMYSLLNAENISTSNVKTALEAINKYYNFDKNLKPGWVVNIIIATSRDWEYNQIQKISFPVDNTYELVAEADANYNYSVYKKEKKLTSYTMRRKILVKDSIYQSAKNAGVPNSITAEFFKVLSWDVDFQREIQENDVMEVVFDCMYDYNDELVSCDNLLYGSLKGSSKNTSFYKYNKAYYHEDGKSASKTLIRTPTLNSRLSSSFGVRQHPVLGYTSFHSGVDFAAATGTPVYASGNGVIAKKYYSTTYGNYIKIRHNPYLETAYAHLHSFAKGIKEGDRVKQGQLIGYVGATGRVTGAHLHYEVLVNKKQINPLIIKTPSNDELKGEPLEDFKLYKDTFNSFFVRIPRVGKILSPKDI